MKIKAFATWHQFANCNGSSLSLPVIFSSTLIYLLVTIMLFPLLFLYFLILKFKFDLSHFSVFFSSHLTYPISLFPHLFIFPFPFLDASLLHYRFFFSYFVPIFFPFVFSLPISYLFIYFSLSSGPLFFMFFFSILDYNVYIN